ncbi:ATP:cob(I)alamin adenosyltransferase [Streptomyces sulphureus]|uniref:ATP:cob(I)alamin adenosyltransferase n=1 Tax=Streptomyces sulphureus TaxID=47758 RepID=UPI000381DBA2|nr:ATP:cob(I)alamin adenosyltransferase [Streptomyces sulphureus]
MTDVAPAHLRLTASGDVEEANAAIGAALSTDSMESEFDVLLDAVQRDLLALAAELLEPSAARVDRACLDRLDSARRRYAHQDPLPPGNHVLAGRSDAAGLLRLARAVTRRAERSVRALAAAEPQTSSQLPAAYLDGLADLLPVLALRVERAAPGYVTMGACNDSPARTA